jgi:bifunctional DNA-binding transcriptional regulator/antitoxin component of YhaV-PrlF toxin-antitoxin module
MDRAFEATFDDQGHFELPQEVRDRHGLTSGKRVKIEEHGNKLVIEAVNSETAPSKPRARSMHDLVGSLGPVPNSLQTLMQERKNDREREDRAIGS